MRLGLFVLGELRMKNSVKQVASLFIVLAVGSLAPVGHAQILAKVADIISVKDGNTGAIAGPIAPESGFTQIGTNLWFTTSGGGIVAAGDVCIYNPANSNITEVASLNGSNGKTPWASSIVVANGLGWFTTSTGGAESKGTLCSIDLTNYTITDVYDFHSINPTNGLFVGQTPHSTPIQIGQDLWFTTSAGGSTNTAALGTVVKYSLVNNTLTNVFQLDKTNYGRQPIGGSLVKAGNAYYFLCFQGGSNNYSGTYPNGAGTMCKITFDNSGNPTLTKVLDMPGGFIGFPVGNPVYDNTNYLYFTTVGSVTNPGALCRYDMTAQTVVSLFNFVTNGVALTNYGKQAYTTPVLYNNMLYFPTFAGGTTTYGTFNMYNLSNNTMTKMADLERLTGQALGGQAQYGYGTIYASQIADTNLGRVSIYFPIIHGGTCTVGATGGNGTILRISNLPPPVQPPPPIVASIQQDPGGMKLSWTGGYGPFNVDWTPDLGAGPWTTNWLAGLQSSSVVISVSNAPAFFRITGTNQ
jgi:hypothetical protein